MLKLGFIRAAEEWPSVFWHPEKQALLVIYVDDFKLAAREEDHAEIWAAIRSVIDMDEETLDGRFLG